MLVSRLHILGAALFSVTCLSLPGCRTADSSESASVKSNPDERRYTVNSDCQAKSDVSDAAMTLHLCGAEASALSDRFSDQRHAFASKDGHVKISCTSQAACTVALTRDPNEWPNPDHVVIVGDTNAWTVQTMPSDDALRLFNALGNLRNQFGNVSYFIPSLTISLSQGEAEHGVVSFEVNAFNEPRSASGGSR